ncbi:ABC transporter ATP-binding protein [Actinomycetospora sp.]|uniref:ABC transporter ATP-binding protein n=1 Tax=Actinomycetospora sp. TaxID=1872135 RepID=UPI002F402CE5
MVLSLVADQVGFAYGQTPVLTGATLPRVRSGTVTALVGPNGTGKSTLLKCLAGLETPTGSVRVEDADGEPAGRLGDHVLYMPQDLPSSSSLGVFEVVLLARQRRSGGTRRVPKEAVRDVEATLQRVGLGALAMRPLSALSGGQRQLVSLAQALVRRPSVLLLDEPTSNLDLRNQLHILGLIRDLATTAPAAVVVSVHDLSLAARYADQVAVLHAGGVHAVGPPEDVLTEEMLRDVYGVEAIISRTADGTTTVDARGLSEQSRVAEASARP